MHYACAVNIARPPHLQYGLLLNMSTVHREHASLLCIASVLVCATIVIIVSSLSKPIFSYPVTARLLEV